LLKDLWEVGNKMTKKLKRCFFTTHLLFSVSLSLSCSHFTRTMEISHKNTLFTQACCFLIVNLVFVFILRILRVSVESPDSVTYRLFTLDNFHCFPNIEILRILSFAVRYPCLVPTLLISSFFCFPVQVMFFPFRHA
jgi:hypothetical protein